MIRRNPGWERGGEGGFIDETSEVNKDLEWGEKVLNITKDIIGDLKIAEFFSYDGVLLFRIDVIGPYQYSLEDKHEGKVYGYSYLGDPFLSFDKLGKQKSKKELQDKIDESLKIIKDLIMKEGMKRPGE